MRNKHLDKYGKAKAIGIYRVTDCRTRQRNQTKPLPFSHQVLPQRATPVFRQPKGTENDLGNNWWRVYYEAFKAGRSVRYGLRKKQSAALIIRKHDSKLMGFSGSREEGVGWCKAANEVFYDDYICFEFDGGTHDLFRRQ